MSHLIVIALVGAASFAVRAALDTLGPRLALARALRGGRVRVPVRAALAGRTVPAVLVRTGDDVRVVGRGVHWVADLEELRRCAHRGVVDTAAGVVGRGYELQDADGAPRAVEVDHAWFAVLDAVTGAPTGARPLSASRLTPWAARPTHLVLATLAAALAATVAGGLLALTTERTSPVVRVEQDTLMCWVEWVEDGRPVAGAPDCPYPVPAVGEPMAYLTTPWPIQGNAWDPDLAGLMVAAPALLAAALLVSALAVGGWRARRPSLRLTARATGATPGSPAARDDQRADAGHESFDEFLDRASTRLAWLEDPQYRPGPPGNPWRADLGRALATTPYRLLGGSLFLAGLAWVDAWPSPVLVGLLAVAALAAARSAWRLGALMHQLGETWSQPYTSEWRFRAARSPDGDWVVLLMLGSTPRWFVAVPGRPPLAGTALVRGDLTEGGSVHLEVDGDLWLPASGVVRVDEDWAREIREALTFEMTGRLDLGHRVDGHESATTG